MLVQLFETRQPLFEINYDKTKDRFLKRLVGRVTCGLYPDSETGRVRVDHNAGGDVTFWDDIPSAGNEDYSLSWNHWENKLRYTEADVQHWFKFAYYTCLRLDPTTNRANNPSIYTEWMLSRYISGGIKRWEDMETIAEYLEQYDNFKVKQVFKRMRKLGLLSDEEHAALNDVNKISNNTELFQAVNIGREWLNQNETVAAKEQFAKYCEWDRNGGIEILWPHAAPRPLAGAITKDTDDVGAMAKEELEMFTKVGMVLRLCTVQASVALFQQATAWCTARPGNTNFDNYKNGDGRGDTPHRQLVVIIDNVNKKLYQFHPQSNQYLDEADEPITAPLAIPIVLHDRAAKVYGRSARELFKAMGGDDSGQMYAYAEDIGLNDPNLGSKLWETYKRNPIAFQLPELDQISRMYTAETGHGVPAEEALSICKTLFPSRAPTGGEQDWLSAVLAGTLVKPDDNLLKAFSDRVAGYPSILLNYYQGSAEWTAMRDRMVNEWIIGARNLSTLTNASLWMTYSQKQQRNAAFTAAVLDKVFKAFKFQSDEITKIIIRYCENKKESDSQEDSDADALKQFLTYTDNVPKEAVAYYLQHRSPWARMSLWALILSRPIPNMLDMVDVEQYLMYQHNPKSEDYWARLDLLTNIAKQPQTRAQVTPDLIQRMFYGLYSFRFFDVASSTQWFKELMSDPKNMDAAKRGLVSSLEFLYTAPQFSADSFLHALYEVPEMMRCLTSEDDAAAIRYLLNHPRLDAGRFRYSLQIMANSAEYSQTPARKAQLGDMIMKAGQTRFDKQALSASEYVDVIGNVLVNIGVTPSFWEFYFENDEWDILGGLWMRYKNHIPAEIGARIKAKSPLFR